MKFELEEYHHGVTDEELIADLKRVALELNKDSFTYDQYKEIGKFSDTTYRNKFGSWLKALERAGLRGTRNQHITGEQFFQDLEETWVKLGRQPKYAEMKTPLSRYSSHTYQKRFGTWRKALEAFVAFVNNEERTSSEGAVKDADVESSTRHKTKRGINWRLRFLVMRRDNFKCKSCGRSPATDPSIVLHVDHIRAWTNGGETVLENLQTLCSKCNIGKNDLE